MSKMEALQRKPWYLQVVLFGSVALLVYAAFWYFVTSGTRSETRQIEEKVAQLQQSNARAQIASQRLSEFKVAHARAQADYDDLKALLPEQREITMVLEGLQERARGRLTVRRFTPKDDVQQDYYSGKPVEVEVTGAYNNLGAFFAQMAAYQRIVSITDFKVSKLEDKAQDPGKTIDAQFLMTAYYASTENLKKTEEPKAKKKKAAAAAPTDGAAAPAPAK